MDHNNNQIVYYVRHFKAILLSRFSEEKFQYTEGTFKLHHRSTNPLNLNYYD